MNLIRLYHTLRPLRAVQWTDRPTRPVKTAWLRARSIPALQLQYAQALSRAELPCFLTTDVFDPHSGEAHFLNVAHVFSQEAIDWDFAQHGKLWAYHLNYFGWLERIHDPAAAQRLMLNYCRSTGKKSIGSEPYPASRRIQHWTGALLRHGFQDREILARLYADAWHVARLPEYHLQANHLLQNGLALFAAAQVFNDKRLHEIARQILGAEMRRQFLADGGHVERSASYTVDLCARALWCLHLQEHTRRFDGDALLKQMRSVVSGMLSWLDAYRFSDDSLAVIGDSSPDMMPPLSTVRKAATALGIRPKIRPLRESGYRKAGGKNWEAVLNVGSAAPDYQPGHSHADALTFCIHAYGKPLVVDTGIYTYERSARRTWERGTEAHNTVTVGGKNSSDVWASFRMGRRARVAILQENESSVTAAHNGYSSIGLRHLRTYDWREVNDLLITDSLKGKTTSEAVSFIHFHPGVRLEQTGEAAWHAGGCRIFLRGFVSVTTEPYEWAAGFNSLRSAVRLRCVWDAPETEFRFHF